MANFINSNCGGCGMVGTKRVRLLLAAMGLLLLLAGCADRKHLVGYDRAPAGNLTGPAMNVNYFIDARPENEHTGAGVGLLNSSTYDTMYTEPVADGIARTLAGELRAAGFAATTDLVTGTVHHFQAVRVPPLESYVPYLNNVTWLWTDDSIAVSLKVQVTLTDRTRNLMLLDQAYDASNDTEIWVGFLNLDSRVNSFTRNDLAELLRRGLEKIMQHAVADIREAITRPRQH